NLVVNAVGSLVLFFLFERIGWMPHVGIAIATTVAGWINALLLLLTLLRAGDYRADRRLLRNAWLILLASVIMGAMLLVLLYWTEPYFAADRRIITRAAALAGLVGAGVGIYGILIM